MCKAHVIALQSLQQTLPFSKSKLLLFAGVQKAEEMSAYEQERAEHIARNKARMAALHLPTLANTVAPQKEARPAKQRGISCKRHKAPVSWHTPVHCSLKPMCFDLLDLQCLQSSVGVWDVIPLRS